MTAPTLQSITITPVAPILAAGTSLQLTATGVYSDQTTIDLTNQVSWTTSNDNIATVDPTGLLTGEKTGFATITASFQGVSDSNPVVVTSANLTSIVVQPVDANLPPFGSQQMTATGIFSDDTTQDLTHSVSWTTDHPLVAWVRNWPARAGEVTGVLIGTANISATFEGITGSAPVTVSILNSLSITPSNPSLAVGEAERLSAIGTFTGSGRTIDLTNFVSWSTSNRKSAAIDDFFPKGKLTGKGVGSATITANFHFGTLVAATTATVTPATLQSIAVTPRSRVSFSGHQST